MRNLKGQFVKGHKENLGKHRNPLLANELEKNCQFCGKKFKRFYVDMSKFRRKKFCSKKCVDANTREQRIGEKNCMWKGGITRERTKIMRTKQYIIWRKAVFERDNYKCIICGEKWNKKNGNKTNIQADHIKPFSKYIKLRFAIDNGRTLCKPCHYKTDTYGGKINKRKIR